MRFTIRDMLWLMVVVGLGTGWAIERHRSKALEHRVSVVEAETENSRTAIQRLYHDLERIEQDIRPHGLSIAWSSDFRPTVQAKRPALK
jgi:hypothetical protein